MSEITKSTGIDLGDDLLGTRTVQIGAKTGEAGPREPSAVERATAAAEAAARREAGERDPDSVDELLLNAKILVSEGLLEDAKKTLRRVQRKDPANLAARDRLEEIHRIEVKRLLGQDDGSTGGGFVRAKKKTEPAAEDGASVAAALERDLGLEPGAEERFFADPADREAFFANLDALCADASPTDRIDLGIGFLEMEFFDSALRMFRSAARSEPGERRARALLAAAWIAKGNGFEAMLEIEALVADQSAPPEEKVDYGYLAGRAQELLENFPTAARWYRAVLQIEPGYRDSEDRLRRCARMAKR